HTSEEYLELLEIIGELQHKQEEADAFRLKSKIETVLMGLGFTMPDMEKNVRAFSGGWQMRIALAKLLLKEPSVLLLDEPTNHLDIESLQWLEDYLRNYNGAIMLISHDRAFLDSLTKKTFALSLGSMHIYAGNYSFYETERLIRKEQAINQKKNQESQLKQTQEFIDRFRYKASKARQVQSRVRQMEKVELIEIEDEEDEIHFHFPTAQSSGRVVMELKNIHKEYPAANGNDTKVVYEDLTYTIERGDRIAIVGVNGAGKSTISKIAAGVEAYQGGERIEGYNVIVSYFAQHQADELNPNKEVLQTVDEVADGEIRTRLRAILGSFLFKGDDVFKKVKVLSGGEKSRLALAKMLLAPANFLIMDEPTNHLDMRSKNVLQEALKEFDGTYLIVSHDRAFLDIIVNKVLEISPNGAVRTYLGNVSDYIAKKKTEKKQLNADIGQVKAEKRSADKAASNVRAEESQKSKGKSEPEPEKPKKNLHQLKKRLEQVEKDIAYAEEQKAGLEKKMASEEFIKHPLKAKTISAEYDAATKKLNELMSEWEKLSSEIG
ncbi:MAG: ABC-F family ATP-binding cassette domain-containing protein, partial [Bacteroidota bacterium]